MLFGQVIYKQKYKKCLRCLIAKFRVRVEVYERAFLLPLKELLKKSHHLRAYLSIALRPQTYQVSLPAFSPSWLTDKDLVT